MNNKINKETEIMTPDELRTFPGLEDISDEYAYEVLQTFKELAEFVFDFVIEQESKEIEKKRRNDLTDKNTPC